MHTPLPYTAGSLGRRSGRLYRTLGLLTLGLLGSQAAQAQLTGPKAIPGDYASVAAAVAALNAQGVGAGGVTFNVAAGYTETAANLLITATGTQANPIVFQKAGSGANPLLTAGVGTSTALDFVLGLAGSDYVTFDGLDVAENAANATATAQLEFGYALFRPSPTDGCQNNTFRNCVVTLNKTNVATIGIAGLAGTPTSAAAVAATSPSGANSNNAVQSCVVTNANIGINFAAGSTTTAANFDQNNLVGVAAGGSTGGNTVGNFGSLTQSGWGIGGSQQNGLRVAGNTLNSTLNYTSATASTPVAASTVTTTLRGIFGNGGTSSNLDVVNNTITLASGATASLLAGIDNSIGSTGASNTVNITGNTVTNCAYATATTGAFSGIVNSASATTVNLNNNQVTNNTSAGTGTVLLVSGGSPTTLNLNGNTLTGNVKQAAGATSSVTMQCLTAATAAVTAANNTISNNSIVTSGTSTSTATLIGYYQNSSPASETLTGNTITNLSVSGTSTSTGHVVTGIRSFPLSTTVTVISQNVIGGLAIASGSGTTTGLSLISGGGTGSSIARNKVYNLSAAGTAAVVNGVSISGGGTFPVVNNLVGDLRAPDATGLLAVSGLNVSSGTAVNAYFNTLYLNAQSTGATFGTSGLYLNSTSTTLDARNNVVVNKSTAAGAGGLTVAFRRVSGTAGTAPANYASTSNNNLLFAGTPSAANLLYAEGSTAPTNAQQTVAAYRAFVGPRESAAVTEDVPFLSTTGTAATFLHVNPAVPTQVESGGTPVAGVTVDFDGDPRNATTPDIGADEGAFTPSDLSPPTITFTPLGNTASTANRTLDVTIADPSGIATGANAPRLFFRKGNSGAFQSVPATSVNGSVYTFTLDYALVGGVAGFDAIQYYVVAQDASANNNVGSNPPGGTFSTPPAQVYQYLIQGQLSGTYYVGTGASPNPARTYPTLTAAVSAYNNNQLGGAVTFLLLDASYGPNESFPLVIGANADASATNTLTIKPNAGVTTTLTGSNSTALLALNGADYVTLDGNSGGTISATDPRPSRNWTLTNTNAGTSSSVLWVTTPTANGGNPATNNALRNLNVVGSGGAQTLAGILVTAGSTNTAPNANNTIQNNAVSAATYGIATQGVGAALKSTGTVISQNDLTATGAAAIGRFGITAWFEDGVQVTQNTVDGIAFAGTGDVWGISLGFAGIGNSTFTGNEVTNATVSRNYVGTVRQTNTYSAVGIGVASAAAGTTTVANNMVAGVSANGTSPDFGAGIYLGGGTGSTTRVLYNSVSMSGTQTGGTQPSYALAVGGSTPTVELRNNVLANTQNTGGNGVALGLAYSSTAGAYAGLTSSNNDLFVGSGSTFFVGQTGGLSTSGTTRATLAALNAETGQDAPTTSLSVDPQFVSATDLHAAAAALNGAATPIAGITTDFDGQTRNATRPDIGADEFTLNIDVAATAVVAPAAGGSCFGNAEPVTVSLTNAASAALNFAAYPVTVSVSIAPPGGGAAQTFTTVVNTGTLAAGASQNVTLPGTADLSTPGAYTVTYNVQMTGDENPANNALAPVTVTNTPRTAAFSYPSGTICAGSSASVAATLAAGSTTGGTFSSTAGLTLDPATGAINPATSTAGTYTVTYTVAASGNCLVLSATQSVTIAPATSAAFSYGGGTFCVSGANPTATVTGTAGGTFSSTSGLTLNPTTGAITLSSSTPGTYTVTYSVAGPCPSSSTQQVTITTAPLANFGYGATPSFCVSGATNPAPTFGAGASGGTFSSTAGLSLNPTTGVITLASSTPGTYTVTNTIAASGGCASATATATVTINAAPSAALTAAGPTTFCQGGSVVLTAPAGTGNTYQFLRNGTAIAGATAASYTANQSGSYAVIVTNAAGCSATTSLATVVTVNPLPATPTLSTSGSAAAGITLTSSAATGNQFYLNGVPVPGATGQTYLVNSGTRNGVYTVVTTSAQGCASAPSAPVNVTVTAAGSALPAASVRLFPNPTPDGLLSVELRGYAKPATLTVLNALGQVVHTLPAVSLNGTTALHLADVAAGVYVLRVTAAGETTQTVRFTKQ